MKTVRRFILTLLVAAGAILGVSAQAQAGYNYLGTYTCYPISGDSYTWFKATSWWNSSTSKTWHFSFRENNGLSGAGWHNLTLYGTQIFGSSPYDDNPEEKYKTITGGTNATNKRTWTANFTDFVGGIPVGNRSCSLTL